MDDLRHALHGLFARLIRVWPQQHLTARQRRPIGFVRCHGAGRPGNDHVGRSKPSRSVCGLLALHHQHGGVWPRLKLLQAVQRPWRWPLAHSPALSVPCPRDNLLALACGFVAGHIAQHFAVAIEVSPPRGRRAVARVRAGAVGAGFRHWRHHAARRLLLRLGLRVVPVHARSRLGLAPEFSVGFAHRKAVDCRVEAHKVAPVVTGCKVSPCARGDVDLERLPCGATQIARHPGIAALAAGWQPGCKVSLSRCEELTGQAVEVEAGHRHANVV